MTHTEPHASSGGRRPGAWAIARRAAVIGTVANLGAVVALGLLARQTGRSAAAPINATSHVIHGDKAGTVDHFDASHTLPGAMINHSAAIFWALPFTWWLSRRQYRSAGQIALGAAATSGAAGVIDYGLMPRRLTPGWEHALPAPAVVATLGALALGLAVGALVTREPAER